MTDNTFKIKDGLFMIKTPLEGSPLKSINNFFIKGGEKNLLVDTAFNRKDCFDSIKNGIEALGCSLENTDIFITHMHADHVGLVYKLKNSKNRVYAGIKDGETVNRLNTKDYWDRVENTSVVSGIPLEERIPLACHVAFINRPEGTVDFNFVEEGDILEYGNYHLKVLSLAGHTPGQMGLYDEREGLLFAGDHILNKITPHLTCWDLENDYLGIFLENLEKVKKLNLKLVLSGHRELCENPYERIDFLKEHHRKRLDETLRSLEEGKWKTAYECAAYLTWSFRTSFKDFPPQQKWFASGETLCHLQHLYFLGRIRRKIINGKALFTL